MLGVERAPIEVRHDGLRHSVRIGDAIDFEIEDIVPFGVNRVRPSLGWSHRIAIRLLSILGSEKILRVRRLAILSLVVLAGCGTSVLDPAKEEHTIRSSITKLGAPVQSVNCPSGVKLGKGIVTYCTVTLRSGETLSIKGTQLDNKGTVHYSSTTMIAGAVENTIEVRLRQLGVAATATRPRHVPLVVGSRFTCNLRDNAGDTAYISVTIVNSTGEFKLGRVVR